MEEVNVEQLGRKRESKRKRKRRVVGMRWWWRQEVQDILAPRKAVGEVCRLGMVGLADKAVALLLLVVVQVEDKVVRVDTVAEWVDRGEDSKAVWVEDKLVSVDKVAVWWWDKVVWWGDRWV